MGNGAFAETLAGFTEHRTYYDGQMPLEESVTTSGNTTLTRNFVGARGIEAMFLTQGGNATTSYPLYDVHGNMVATVQKNGSGTSWTTQDERSYDVWGSVRSGATTGGPRGRYCANLGHVQDDESGLVYMRARYYEPESGRFISEDPAMRDRNFFIYASSNPITACDYTGNDTMSIFGAFMSGLVWLLVTAGQQKAQGRFDMRELIGAFIKGLICYGAAKVGAGRLVEAVESGATVGIGARLLGFTAAGFINMAGCAFVDLITGDFEWSDLVLNFFCGGLAGIAGGYLPGGAKGGELYAQDFALGAAAGGVTLFFDVLND